MHFKQIILANIIYFNLSPLSHNNEINNWS